MIDFRGLPKHWEVKKLGEVCEIKRGKSKNRPRNDPSLFGGKYPFIQTGDIREANGGYINKFSQTYSEKGLQQSKLWSKGTLCITIAANIGETAILNIDACFPDSVVGLVCNEKVLLNKFTNYFFISHKSKLEKLAPATAQKNINVDILEKVIFPLPPLTEQAAIVAKIEELLSDLENGKQQLLIAQAQLKVYRQSLLKWAFEGKLTNENVKEGELPKGWKWVKTGEVIDVINNGYTPKNNFLSEGSGEVPFIKVYNLNFNGTLNFKKNPTFIPDSVHKKDLKRSICYPDDVLINIVGPPLGKVSIVTNQYPEWNINQAIVMFRPNERVLSKYIAYFLLNPVTTNWLEGTSKATAGQWNVKVSTCREIPMPFPPLEQQQRIVDELESKLTVCDKIEETVSQSLLQAETLRQSILKKAFEGKLV